MEREGRRERERGGERREREREFLSEIERVRVRIRERVVSVFRVELVSFNICYLIMSVGIYF